MGSYLLLKQLNILQIYFVGRFYAVSGSYLHRWDESIVKNMEIQYSPPLIKIEDWLQMAEIK